MAPPGVINFDNILLFTSGLQKSSVSFIPLQLIFISWGRRFSLFSPKKSQILIETQESDSLLSVKVGVAPLRLNSIRLAEGIGFHYRIDPSVDTTFI